MQQYQFLIAPLMGWFAAQGIKFAFTLRKDGIGWGDLVQSGGMPSSHTSLIVALATVVGMSEGMSSIAFAVVASIAGIIMYDAMGVRRTTGQQTAAINELAKANKQKLKAEISNARGHGPLEVAVGFLVGVLVGIVVYSVG